MYIPGPYARKVAVAAGPAEALDAATSCQYCSTCSSTSHTMIESTRIMMSVYATMSVVHINAEYKRSFDDMKWTKCILMPILILYLSRTKRTVRKYASIQMLIIGLVFATIGDYYMLQFDSLSSGGKVYTPVGETTDPFVRAIISFMLMHACYVAAFLFVPSKYSPGYISSYAASTMAAAVVISVSALQNLMLKAVITDTNLRTYVISYGVFVSITLLLGVNSLNIFRHVDQGRYCCVGATLFAISDAMICGTTFNLFGIKPNGLSYAAIISLYVVAQASVIIGLSSGVRSNTHSKWR